MSRRTYNAREVADAALIRAYRHAVGLFASRSQAAREVGCSRGSLEHRYSGRVTPTLGDVAELLEAAGTPDPDLRAVNVLLLQLPPLVG